MKEVLKLDSCIKMKLRFIILSIKDGHQIVNWSLCHYSSIKDVIDHMSMSSMDKKKASENAKVGNHFNLIVDATPATLCYADDLHYNNTPHGMFSIGSPQSTM